MQSALHASQVAQATDAYLEALRAGRRPEVEDFAARYPEIAQVLRDMLPALAALEDSQGGDSSNESNASGAPDEALRELGDFHLIREVGRGGMGVVYEAWQQSLGRRVAIKVLPFAAALDARQLQRFKNEAQAAAQLHHTHIVPVYAVGSERGVHYYAMQFIEGRSVATLVDELRVARGQAPSGSSDHASPADVTTAHGEAKSGGATKSGGSAARDDSTRGLLQATTARSPQRQGYFRQVARLGAEAAQALEHSHSLGIVHRDIKPGNLMIDVHGHLWVTDFGLAQMRSDSRLTMTGDLVGTLRYMSPEQLLAGRVPVDHRCDIYSLGATLYELLTLEPAISGDDRQALLRQISFDDPPPARKIDRAVPAELETIVGKAMAKNPADRYGTAQEFVDDLERFLRDEPIRARRPTLRQHVQKWAARHRELVATAIVGALLLMAAVSASAIWVAATRQQALSRVETALTAESKAKARAEEGFRQAREAVDTYLTAVADEELLDEPGMTPLRDRLLTDALAYYTKFVEQQPADVIDRHELAMAYARIGDIKNAQGLGDDALAAHKESAAHFDALLASPNPPHRWFLESGVQLVSYGTLLATLGQADEGEQALRRAVEQLEKSGQPDAQVHLSPAYHDLGWLAKETGRFEQAEKWLGSARTISEELVAEKPDDAHAQLLLASDYMELANVARAQEQFQTAQQWNDRAIGLLEPEPETRQRTADERFKLVLGYNNQAETLYKLQQPEAARAMFEKGQAACRALIEVEPNLSGPRMMMAGISQNLAYLDNQAGQVERACEGYREAVAQFERLLRDDPHSLEKRFFTVQTYGNLVEAELARGQGAAALDTAQAALRLLAEAEGGEDFSQLRELSGVAYCNAGRAQFALARYDEAFASFDQARTVLEGQAARLVAAAAELLNALTKDAAHDSHSDEQVERLKGAAIRFLTDAKSVDPDALAGIGEKPEFALLQARPDFQVVAK